LTELPRIKERLEELKDLGWGSGLATESVRMPDAAGSRLPSGDPYATIFHAALAEKKYGDALKAQQAGEARRKAENQDIDPRGPGDH
jgi:hypothetical protein